MSDGDDQELLENARAGDRAAMDVLIRRYANLVYGIAQRQTGDAQLAADIAQAVFLVFVRRVNSIRKARSLASWLMQTTRYAVLDAKRNARRREHHERSAARPEHSMTPPTERGEMAMLDDAITRLRKSDREIVAMRFLSGQEIGLIAVTLGIGEDAARKRIARAVERLKAMFAGKGTVASIDALLAAAATVSIPPTVLDSCLSLAGSGVASTAAAAAVAQGVLKTYAMHKLIFVGAALAASLAVGIVTVTGVIAGLPKPRALKIDSSPQAPTPSISNAQALAQLSPLYAPLVDKAMRVIAPPFPQARAVYADVAYPYAKGSANLRSLGFEWTATGLANTYMSYGDQSLDEIIDLALSIPWYHVEGVVKLTFPAVHGDFVVRADATRQQKLDALAELIAQRTTQRVRFVRGTRKMLCVVLHGETRPPPKDNGGFGVLVLTAMPLDDATLKRWIGGWHPRGSTHGFGMDQASPQLGAPFFIDGETREEPGLRGVSLTPIAADARLKRDDPDFAKKLRKVLDNVQMQIGGDWRIEERELEVFTLAQAGG